MWNGFCNEYLKLYVMFTCNISRMHVAKIISHVDIIMLHVDIAMLYNDTNTSYFDTNKAHINNLSCT